jgi:hypothetical protein
MQHGRTFKHNVCLYRSIHVARIEVVCYPAADAAFSHISTPARAALHSLDRPASVLPRCAILSIGVALVAKVEHG